MILNLNSGVPKKYIDEKDAANKGLIDAEAQNRSSADQTLQGNINSEATTRKNADDALQALIDDLEENYQGLGSAAHKTAGNAVGNVPVVQSNGKLDPSIMPDLTISEFKGSDHISSESCLDYVVESKLFKSRDNLSEPCTGKLARDRGGNYSIYFIIAFGHKRFTVFQNVYSIKNEGLIGDRSKWALINACATLNAL